MDEKFNNDDLFKDLFGISPEDMEEGAELNEVDKAKLNCIDRIKEYADELYDAVTYHESQNEKATVQCLSKYVASLISIISLCEDDSISDEEKINEIKRIDSSVSDASFEDVLNLYDPMEEEGMDIYEIENEEKNEGISSEELLQKLLEDSDDKKDENPNTNDDTEW